MARHDELLEEGDAQLLERHVLPSSRRDGREPLTTWTYKPDEDPAGLRGLPHKIRQLFS